VSRLVGIDHVQLAMPPGGEELARHFYRDVLGLSEVAKPAELAARGGCWFESPGLKLHLGVEADFRPALKAHPALLVDHLAPLMARLAEAGHAPQADGPLDGRARCYVSDPFDNRLELIEAIPRS
jgi:catechol 2,3-dioxygenase-like lactoylglutathione lyase family enzyme